MSSRHCTLSVPVEHGCFAGHFPGNPIVPGALLIQWLLQALRQHLSTQDIVAISSIKFAAPLKPGDQCDLHIDAPDDDWARAQKLRLSCHCRDALVCKAVVVVGTR